MKKIISEEKNRASQNVNKKKDRIKINKDTRNTIIISVSIIMVFLIVLLFISFGIKGAKSLFSSYSHAYNEGKEKTYNEKYADYKANMMEKYRVSNRVSIYIDDLKEEEKLEVLKVSDIEYVIEDAKDNDEKAIAWLEVPGEGTYVIDLKASEFIIDNERAHVLARIPYPELTNVRIIEEDVKLLLFRDNVFNGSYGAGEDMAREHYREALYLINKEFVSNQNFYLNAKEAAIRSVESLIFQLNPKVKNLIVDVEFY